METGAGSLDEITEQIGCQARGLPTLFRGREEGREEQKVEGCGHLGSSPDCVTRARYLTSLCLDVPPNL